jgi:hypothetical protein
MGQKLLTKPLKKGGKTFRCLPRRVYQKYVRRIPAKKVAHVRKRVSGFPTLHSWVHDSPLEDSPMWGGGGGLQGHTPTGPINSASAMSVERSPPTPSSKKFSQLSPQGTMGAKKRKCKSPIRLYPPPVLSLILPEDTPEPELRPPAPAEPTAPQQAGGEPAQCQFEDPPASSDPTMVAGPAGEASGAAAHVQQLILAPALAGDGVSGPAAAENPPWDAGAVLEVSGPTRAFRDAVVSLALAGDGFWDPAAAENPPWKAEAVPEVSGLVNASRDGVVEPVPAENGVLSRAGKVSPIMEVGAVSEVSGPTRASWDAVAAHALAGDGFSDPAAAEKPSLGAGVVPEVSVPANVAGDDVVEPAPAENGVLSPAVAGNPIIEAETAPEVSAPIPMPWSAVAPAQVGDAYHVNEVSNPEATGIPTVGVGTSAEVSMPSTKPWEAVVELASAGDEAPNPALDANPVIEAEALPEVSTPTTVPWEAVAEPAPAGDRVPTPDVNADPILEAGAAHGESLNAVGVSEAVVGRSPARAGVSSPASQGNHPVVADPVPAGPVNTAEVPDSEPAEQADFPRTPMPASGHAEEPHLTAADLEGAAGPRVTVSKDTILECDQVQVQDAAAGSAAAEHFSLIRALLGNPALVAAAGIVGDAAGRGAVVKSAAAGDAIIETAGMRNPPSMEAGNAPEASMRNVDLQEAVVQSAGAGDDNMDSAATRSPLTMEAATAPQAFMSIASAADTAVEPAPAEDAIVTSGSFRNPGMEVAATQVVSGAPPEPRVDAELFPEVSERSAPATEAGAESAPAGDANKDSNMHHMSHQGASLTPSQLLPQQLPEVEGNPSQEAAAFRFSAMGRDIAAEARACATAAAEVRSRAAEQAAASALHTGTIKGVRGESEPGVSRDFERQGAEVRSEQAHGRMEGVRARLGEAVVTALEVMSDFWGVFELYFLEKNGSMTLDKTHLQCGLGFLFRKAMLDVLRREHPNAPDLTRFHDVQ